MKRSVGCRIQRLPYQYHLQTGPKVECGVGYLIVGEGQGADKFRGGRCDAVSRPISISIGYEEVQEPIGNVQIHVFQITRRGPLRGSEAREKETNRKDGSI